VRADDPGGGSGGGASVSRAPVRPRVPLYLHPGSVYASAQAAAVSTILGSSVGVSLFDPTVYGGAWMNVGLRENPAHVGVQNVEVARELLTAEGIPVVAAETGGAHGRRVVFYTDDGSAWVRAL
jgi:chemotaxis receptor (MCP) glutamine deamidase CheD